MIKIAENVMKIDGFFKIKIWWNFEILSKTKLYKLKVPILKMPKSKQSKRSDMNMHHKCDCYHHKIGWILPILIIAIALVPKWYGTMFGKWAIVVLAAVMFLKKFCRCC